MKEGHRTTLESDYNEAVDIKTRLLVQAKLSVYAWSRPLASSVLKKRLTLGGITKETDLYLWNEGGMFKTHVYQLTNAQKCLRGSTILVPGVGYGRNLFQLAAWKPKKIVCFDLFDYPEEWSFVSEKIRTEFSCDSEFYHGDFTALPDSCKHSFDFIISEAVLEHVKDLPAFAKHSYQFLSQGGMFYASFGPLWNGPGGDHICWGDERRLYDHLLLSKEDYSNQLNERFETADVESDSCEAKFMAQEGLFSYLTTDEYLAILTSAGFKKSLLYAKVSTDALECLRKNQDLDNQLTAHGVGAFDRVCTGLYLWMTRQ